MRLTILASNVYALFTEKKKRMKNNFTPSQASLGIETQLLCSGECIFAQLLWLFANAIHILRFLYF